MYPKHQAGMKLLLQNISKYFQGFHDENTYFKASEMQPKFKRIPKQQDLPINFIFIA